MKKCIKCKENKAITEFYAGRAKCKCCVSSERKESYKNNPSIEKERANNYYANNKEKVLVLAKEKRNKEEIKQYTKKYNKEYRDKNAVKLKKYSEEYRKTEKYKIMMKNTRHRRRCVMSAGNLTNIELEVLIETSKVCFWCRKELNGIYHIDHYVPISKGGLHQSSNIVISCPSCNIKKKDILPEIFIKIIGKYDD